MSQTSPESLVDILSRHDRLVEVGIGQNPAIARALVDRGVAVTATDVRECSVPAGVEFIIDDVTDPSPSVYRDADAIYAVRLPPELQRPTLAVSKMDDRPLYFTTLGGDPSVIPAERRTVREGTLFIANG